MQVPLLDLKREYATIKGELDQAVAQVISATQFINGPEVKRFESEIARYCGVKYAIGVASGTDALLISLRAAGVGRGDEVVVPTFSFFATAGTVSNAGATPVFVDIDSDNFNISVTGIEKSITKKTKAIMPVHLFGQCADLDPIMEMAREQKLAVIEDAAQSLSSKYKGRMSGTIGDIGCFSFFPTKNLGCAGDGGMIITDNPDLELAARRLKAHGEARQYHNVYVGYNSRLDTLQAAILLAKLPLLDRWSEARRVNAAYYDRRFSGSRVQIPKVENYARHIYNQYTIKVSNRDKLQQHLNSLGIGNKVYYPVPLHLQECYRDLGYKTGDFPVAEGVAQQALSIPIYPQLTVEEREYVANSILEFIS